GAPGSVVLVGRSHGQEALAALGAQALPDLRGKRMAAYSQSSSYYFALWAMSRAGLGVGEVKLVELGSTLDAGSALREGKADAAAGLVAALELAACDRRGKVLAPSAHPPHLTSPALAAGPEMPGR